MADAPAVPTVPTVSPPPDKPPLIKREPTAIIGGVITLITALLVVAPDLGINLPGAVSKAIGAIVLVAGTFGIRSKVRPV